MPFATVQLVLPLADIGDVISALVPFIVLIIWVISQFVGEDKNKPQPRPKPKREDEVSDKELREQIESFLREAGVESEEPQPQHAEAVESHEKPEYAVVVPPPEPETARQALSDYESVAPGPSAGETVAEHVAEHITQHHFDEDDHMGEEIAQSDERFDAQLHKHFDHALGSLGKPLSVGGTTDAGVQPVIAPNTARQIFNLVRNPQDVRRAIVFSEIINRPTRRLK